MSLQIYNFKLGEERVKLLEIFLKHKAAENIDILKDSHHEHHLMGKCTHLSCQNTDPLSEHILLLVLGIMVNHRNESFKAI